VSAAEPVVFVVDDSRSVREALTSLLGSVGLRAQAFRTAEEFLSAVTADAPACAVLDVRLPGLSGLDLQQRLLAAGQHIPIVFITAHGTVPISVEAMKGGAVEFLVKPFPQHALLDALERALAARHRQQQQRAETADLRRRYEALTAREREVMAHVVAGLLNKQIAGRLGLSEVTVKVHRARAMRKMSIDSLAELVRAADRLSAEPGRDQARRTWIMPRAGG
jgi:FixJ family two-component response regulator